MVLANKGTEFEPLRDLLTIKRLVDEHSGKMPIQSVTVSIKEDALLADQFALTMKQLKYDQQAFDTWSQKCISAKSAAYHKKLEFTLQVHKDCVQAAAHVDADVV